MPGPYNRHLVNVDEQISGCPHLTRKLAYSKSIFIFLTLHKIIDLSIGLSIRNSLDEAKLTVCQPEAGAQEACMLSITYPLLQETPLFVHVFQP